MTTPEPTTTKTLSIGACPPLADLLVDHSDNELSGAEQQFVLNHLATCDRCRTYLTQLNASRNQLATAITENSRVGPAGRVGQARPSERRPTRFTPRQKIAFATAAALLLTLTTAWLTTIRPPRQITTAQPTPSPTPAPQKLLTPPQLTPSQALWQITLLEQQARLKTSLEYLPDSPSFADQRQRNEQLLMRYESMLLMQ